MIVMIRRGPTWGEGPPEAQPGWEEHAARVDALIERGTFVLGGPFADNSGTLVVLEGIGADEAEALLRTDPFVENGVFGHFHVREWINYVDVLSTRAEEP